MLESTHTADPPHCGKVVILHHRQPGLGKRCRVSAQDIRNFQAAENEEEVPASRGSEWRVDIFRVYAPHPAGWWEIGMWDDPHRHLFQPVADRHEVINSRQMSCRFRPLVRRLYLK